MYAYTVKVPYGDVRCCSDLYDSVCRGRTYESRERDEAGWYASCSDTTVQRQHGLHTHVDQTALAVSIC